MTRKEIQQKKASVRLLKRIFDSMYRKCLLTAILIGASCMTLLFAPLVNYSKEYGSTWSGILLSLIMWALVIAAVMMTQKLYRFAAQDSQWERDDDSRIYRRAKMGIVTFSKNPEAIAAELLFVLGATLWVLSGTKLLHLRGILRMSPYSLTFCGFLLHCFFNGKFYIYIKSKHKREIER